MDREKLQRGLALFLDAMRPYAVSVVQSVCAEGKSWDEDFEGRIDNDNRRTAWQMQRMTLPNNGSPLTSLIDYNTLVTFVIAYKDAMLREIGGRQKEYSKMRTWLQELQDTRNNWAHFDNDHLDEDEAERAFSNMIQVAKLLEMGELEDELKRIRVVGHASERANAATPVVGHASERANAATPVVGHASERANAATLGSVAHYGDATAKGTRQPDDTETVDYKGVLTAWYNNVLPQYDIRTGNLDESIFAANIEEVATGVAPMVYQDIVSFFDRTYVTDGIKELVRRVVQALNGTESQNRVISLQTGFGGGKTHALITLYHVVKDSQTFRTLQAAQTMLAPEDMPQFSNAHVAVLTQNTVSPTDGHVVGDASKRRSIDIQTADGITTHTLWGELAWQLGGREAYEQMRQADEQMIAPSSHTLQPIIEKAAPALILIDELADYCVRADGKRVGGGTLFTQTNSFMQTLTEVVSHVPQTMLICTLPASAREVASDEIGQMVLSSLETRVVRVGSSVKPVDDEEVYEVVRRRLFDKVKSTAVVEQVARKYKEMYHNVRNQVPPEADRVAYAERIRKAYPFHPELIEILRSRWGSDSRFQRTRGVLRLLASIVKDLWNRRQSLVGTQALIQTSDVLLENLPTLQSQITSLMGSGWDSVMHADVIGTGSNANKIDDENSDNNIGRFHLGTSVATTVLFASIGSSSQQMGMTSKQMKLCLLKPDAFQHIDVDSTLNKLENIVHYMYRSAIGGEPTYWFQAKPNINILVNQARSDVKQNEVNAEILRMMKQELVGHASERAIAGAATLRGVAHYGHLPVKVLVDPTGDVPEQKQLTIIVLHPEHAKASGVGIQGQTERLIKQIAQQRGGQQRIYRNTILFLMCSELGHATLSMKLREYLACERILQEYSSQLDTEQRKDVAERKRQAETAAKEQLTHAYSTVVKCVRDGLNTYEVQNFAQEMSVQLTSNILTELVDASWLLRRIGMGVINRQGLAPTLEKPVRVLDLYEAFLRFDDKPMITGVDAIINTVNRYCQEGAWKVGCGSPDHWTRQPYSEEQVPFLNPQDETYWLLDPAFVWNVGGSGENSGNGGATGNGGGEEGSGGTGGDRVVGHASERANCSAATLGGVAHYGDNTGGNGEGSGGGSTRTFQRVTINGSVPIENYNELFSSFIQTLRYNHLKIEMKFSAETTATSPLAENSPIVKSITESASQLGLNINFEE